MPRVAIIGSGVSGLAAASTLFENNADFEVFEADAHIGGHAHTVMALISNKYIIINILVLILAHLGPRSDF